MPIADFVVRVEFEVPREVRVIVYESVKGLRIAATSYENRTALRRNRRRGRHPETLGICHRFEWTSRDQTHNPQCAIVRLAKPNIGVGVTSHEMAHAAVWMRELSGDTGPLTAENDEPFVWLLGELVRQAINGMNERGVFDE